MELILVFALSTIVLSSIVLSKIDCKQIANYLKLPVMIGLVYINLAHSHRTSSRYIANRKAAITYPYSSSSSSSSSSASSSSSYYSYPPSTMRQDALPGRRLETETSDSTSLPFSIDTIELVLGNGLAFIVLLQLAINLFGQRLIKLLAANKTNAKNEEGARA